MQRFKHSFPCRELVGPDKKMASHIGILEKGRLVDYGPVAKILMDISNPLRAHLKEMHDCIESSL